MRNLNPFNGPGQDPDWYGSLPRSGLLHGFFHNLCSAMCSCVYVFCCCWLIEDCCMGQRSFPGPPFGSPGPAPPPPVGPGPPGLMGSLLGQPGPPGPPGPVVHTPHESALF